MDIIEIFGKKNTPKDLIVDRIQIVRYPPGTGELEPHQDPYLYQKFFQSVYMSKINQDYKDGGMYFLDNNNEIVKFEERVEVGDLAFGFATLYHGVAKSFSISNNKKSYEYGRWFMGLYTTVSDYVKERHTGKPLDNK